MGEGVTVAVVLECFKDHWAFEDLHRDGSLASDLLFDDMFLFSETISKKKSNEEDDDFERESEA